MTAFSFHFPFSHCLLSQSVDLQPFDPRPLPALHLFRPHLKFQDREQRKDQEQHHEEGETAVDPLSSADGAAECCHRIGKRHPAVEIRDKIPRLGAGRLVKKYITDINASEAMHAVSTVIPNLSGSNPLKTCRAPIIARA